MDLEADGLIRGTGAVEAVGALQDARAGTLGGGTHGQAQSSAASSVAALEWQVLQARNPEWDLEHWTECRALYAGGKRLLGNPKIMAKLFPQNPYENPQVYAQRRERAHYFPYPGTIIDALLAGLSSDPLRITFGSNDEETGGFVPAPNSDWWADFVGDVSDESSDYANDLSPDDSDDDNAAGLPMHHFLLEVMREAEQTRFVWIRCDLPADPSPGAITSKLDEEKAKDAPSLSIVQAESVVDWQYDETGKELLWLLTLEKSTPRNDPRALRGKKEHHTYVLWTQTDWTRYDVDVDLAQPPHPTNKINPSVGPTPHPFQCVPFQRVALSEGLWAMGKLHNLAREHFNKRCAMSWAEYKALFPILYEFLDPNAGAGSDLPLADDADRATSQLRGQGYTQTRVGGDKAMYVGPDVAPFKEARDSCNDTMREMHRVMYSMALSANMDKQALSRSGDSKQQDQISTQIVMMALGMIMRRIARCLLALVARGRREPVPQTIVAGLEHFDVTGVTQAIADAVQVFTGVPINKSKTAYSLYLTSILRKILGDTVTDAQVTSIRSEIEDAFDQDELMRSMLANPAGAGDTQDDGGGGGKSEDDDDEQDDDGDIGKPPRKLGPIRSIKPIGKRK